MDKCKSAMHMLMLLLLSLLCLVSILPVAVQCRRVLEDDDDDGDRQAPLGGGQQIHQCGSSSLGYQCYRQVCNDIGLHWSLGGPPPRDVPNCRYPAAMANSSNGASDAAAATVHFAMVTNYAGYVAMALAGSEGRMSPADSVIGWVDAATGAANVMAYHISGWSSNEVTPDANVALTYVGASLAASTQALTVCFSRQVAALGGAGVDLKAVLLASGGISMNFAASASPGIHKHSMDWGHLCSQKVALVAVRTQGGGSVGDQSHDYSPAVDAHGLMMLSAWLLLVPFGIVAARHRWTTQTVGAPDAWFQVHRIVQLFACLVFGIAFTLPFVTFSDHGQKKDSGAVAAHSAIGIIVAAVTCVHVFGALFRPKPNAPKRLLFNVAHSWMGRTLGGLAVVNILIGVQVYHDNFACSRLKWYLPISLLVVAWIAVFVFLERKRSAMAFPNIIAMPITTQESGGLSTDRYRMMGGEPGHSELTHMTAGMARSSAVPRPHSPEPSFSLE